MCILWSAAAIGVLPYDATAALSSTGHIYDPVAVMLSKSFNANSAAHATLKLSVLGLAFSAISTTVIGSLLTLTQFLEDVFEVRKITESKKRSTTKIFLKIFSVLPCVIIAASGNENLYFYATAFAGAFPVTALWGLFPALCYLRLRHRQRERVEDLSLRTTNSTIGAYALAAISIIMLSINLFEIAPTVTGFLNHINRKLAMITMSIWRHITKEWSAICITISIMTGTTGDTMKKQMVPQSGCHK